MFRVGLTGNHQSGQTEVSKVFEEYDVPVFDANLMLKFLINYSEEHIQKIKNRFGDSIYNIGLLDLKKFNTNKEFNDLLDILEFDILKAYETFRLSHKESFYTIFLFDYIFERNLQQTFDYNITSYRPIDHRRFVMKFWKNYNLDIIEEILDNEMDPLFKNKKSDYIIQNYNTYENKFSDIVVGLDKHVKSVHRLIMNKRSENILKSHYL